jgi:hypothetical protein
MFINDIDNVDKSDLNNELRLWREYRIMNTFSKLLDSVLQILDHLLIFLCEYLIIGLILDLTQLLIFFRGDNPLNEFGEYYN